METRKGKELPVQGFPPSGAQQYPAMVNPQYPLPSSLPVPTATQQNLFPSETNSNGMARTSSRRRRANGRSQDQAENTPQIIALEAPKAPPTSYDYSYPNESPKSPTSNNLATFAARAQAASNDLIPGNLAESSPSTSAPNSRAVRRGSINRPPGAVYLEIRGTERKSLSSPRIDPNSPQYSSNITAPKQNLGTESSFPRRASSVSTPLKVVGDTAKTQSRSASKRVSSGTGARAEWASDRSPLQKLEVKLNDISKEEKRARVEEAEQLLKQSKAAGQSRDLSRQGDSLSSRSQSVRVSSDTGPGINKESWNSAAHSPRQASAPDDQKYPSRARRAPGLGETRGVAPLSTQRHSSGTASSPQTDTPLRAVHSAKPSTYTTIPPSGGIATTAYQLGQQSARGLSQSSKSPTAVAQRGNGRVDTFAREPDGRHQRRSSIDQSDGGRTYQEVRVVGQNEAREAQTAMATKRTRLVQAPVGSIGKPRITSSPGFPTADLSVTHDVHNQPTNPENTGE